MEIYKKLFSEKVEIPSIVQRKAQVAFEQIRMEDMSMDKKVDKMGKFKGRVAAAACVGILAMGGVTYAAVSHLWGNAMKGTLEASDEQQKELTDMGMAKVYVAEDYKDMAQTINGVTVVPDVVVSDGKVAYVSFKVFGHQLEKGEEPCFENNLLQILDDDTQLNWYASFYDGLMADENGLLVLYDDGTPVEMIEKNGYETTVARYMDEAGVSEYSFEIMGSDYGDSLLGKTLHIELKNLGTVEKTSFIPNSKTEGVWSFDIALPEASNNVEYQLNKVIPNTSFTVCNVCFSPVSVNVDYEVNDKIDEMNDVEVPMFVGVVLENGEKLPHIIDAGSTGYTDENGRKAFFRSTFMRVIDPKSVVAMLFHIEGEEGLIEIPLQ